MGGSSSSSGKQTHLPISQNRVVYVGIKNRNLKKIPGKAGSLYHQAILAVTSDYQKDIIDPQQMEKDLIGSKFEFHIVEYMDDSQVHAYKVEIREKINIAIKYNLFMMVNILEIQNQWIFISDNCISQFNKQKRKCKSLLIMVENTIQRATIVNMQPGKFQCILSSILPFSMLKSIRSVVIFIYQIEKEYQKFAALYFNKLIKDSTQIYSIIKLRELKQLNKQKKDVSTFKL